MLQRRLASSPEAIYQSLRRRRERLEKKLREVELMYRAALLAEARLDLAALDGIAFGAGPGSFTGLRIACGVAQGLALGADLPVVGVATLQAMAEAARQKSGRTRVIAALDARMREVYVAAYEHDGLRWRVVLEPAVAMPGEAPLPPGNGWTGVGNGFAAYPTLRLARGFQVFGSASYYHKSPDRYTFVGGTPGPRLLEVTPYCPKRSSCGKKGAKATCSWPRVRSMAARADRSRGLLRRAKAMALGSAKVVSSTPRPGLAGGSADA